MAVYFILEDSGDDWRMKIGRARDVIARRRALQTGNSRPLKLVGWINAANDAAEEARLHKKFAALNVRDAEATSKEWFALQPADVLSDLQRAGSSAFVAKNADAFDITGYDNDAVPEFLGVWAWGDFELEECCPFCGCMGGMHYQNASHMFHCINCDTLTNFEAGSPGFRQTEKPEDDFQ